MGPTGPAGMLVACCSPRSPGGGRPSGGRDL